MKRLIVLYDGTWNTLTNPDEVTNVVRVGQSVKPVDKDGIAQVVYYNAGVGSGGFFDRLLGGVFGAGVKDNVKRGLTFLSFNWNSGETPDDAPDEIYIFGFSRGAYTARALAGVIGAIGGIPKVSSFGKAEEVWSHYRKSRKGRDRNKEVIKDLVYELPKDQKLVKCVAVWDTVGSYGIPAGLGLAGLARLITSWTRNFRDNQIGRRIEYGFHAMAIDERRRAFPATAWVPRPPTQLGDEEPPGPEPIVEQVWFAGAHANVGGGYTQTGLSDQALIWMISRVQEETGLEFDEDYIKQHFWPCSACSSWRSYRGWWLSSVWPFVRAIPKTLKAVATGVAPGKGDILDGRVHWSVKERLGRLSLVDQDRYSEYRPKNVKGDVVFTEKTPRERELIELCHGNPKNQKKPGCALRCDLEDMEQGWWWDRRRARRMRNLREKWKDVLTASG
jgi:uncharacterized protein (DUF2235 family)